MGYYQPTLHEIRIREKQKWAEESNTLLHELFHVIYHCYNLDRKSDEEKMVSGFANGMMEAMRRNPELRKYFMKVWNA
jgi:antirestriction protein ArdC